MGCNLKRLTLRRNHLANAWAGDEEDAARPSAELVGKIRTLYPFISRVNFALRLGYASWTKIMAAPSREMPKERGPMTHTSMAGFIEPCEPRAFSDPVVGGGG